VLISRSGRSVLCGGASAALLLSVVLHASPEAAERRPVTLDDQYALRDVSEPAVSPDGAWVAYTVETIDPKEDESQSDVWMTSWDGQRTLRLTTSKQGESMPRFSPDGQYLAFLSGRGDDDEIDQIWLLNRSGGEAEKISDFKGGVTDYVWSPDGKRLAVVAKDPDPDAPEGDKEKAEKKTKPPIVIDRFQFKADIEGYLGARRHHLYLFDLASRKAEALTSGATDERLPSWSPDGSLIAFVTKRGADPDRHDNWDIYVIAAKAGSAARQVTTSDGPDGDPSWESRAAWSPDGKSIAYLQGGPQKLIYYAGFQLAVIPAAGGTPRLLAPTLDRNVNKPRWSPDGGSLYVLLEDDRNVHLAKIPAAGGKFERIVGGKRVVSDYDVGRDGRIAVLTGTPQEPFEVFAVKGAELRALSHQNQELLSKLKLGTTEEASYKSKDGTEIHGLVVKPPDFSPGRPSPAILRIHGGPVSQHQNEFDFDWQLMAAGGYVVIAVNPRGSSGRGEEFAKAIYADWGNKDVQDVLAGVDDAVARKIADPDRLGVGGWSYGGMLTNYTIASDTRFKAATSGASISNILAGYGTDQYVREYEQELGVPWKNLDTWVHNSFPFLHADRITTPTLFLCGEADFNVPLLNSQQMYQALRSLGIDTMLIIYPGQFHGLTKPSYEHDRLQRYLAWYDKYVKKTGGH
jgi:dipeptidyl aminopeptidase/acylaminoacyl peptidase